MSQFKCKNAAPFTYAGYTYDCIADGTYLRNDGLVTFDDGAARLAYQKRQSLKKWSIVGAAVGVAAVGYLLLRKT